MNNHSENHHLRARRTRALGRAIDHLDRKIGLMETQNKRLSNYRLMTFIAGVMLLLLPTPWAKAIPITGAGFLFVWLVIKHHLLNLRLKHYHIWRDIKKSNLARSNVKWSSIPVPPTIAETSGDGIMGRDLELIGERSLHHLLDISVSDRGSRRLANWLTCADPDAHITQGRQNIIRELAALPHFRDRFLLNSCLISRVKIDSEKMTQWLNIPKPQWNIPAAILGSVLLLSLSLWLFSISDKTPLSSLWVIVYAMYLVLFFSGVGKLAPVIQSVQWLDDELSVFRRILLFLERYPLNKLKHLSKVLKVYQTLEKRPSRKIRALKIIATCIGLRNNPIMTFLLNMFFPWDLLLTQWALVQRKKLKTDFSQWMDALSELEAMNALANLSYVHPDYCFPVLSRSTAGESTILKAEALGHPLIAPEHNVKNDLAIEKIGDIALITGSNMAGKSTFLKTVGINLILAYCGGPVNAANFSTSYLRIRTCIRIEDSLADGISSFYAEVKRLKDILADIKQPHKLPVLYFIDEILRGTNNRERLIGSAALVRALTRTFSAGLISTHDLELTSLSTEYDEISNYHFAETIRDDKMRFFYKLKKGPCPTTNALHIMRNAGLPIPG